jgi:hypothetical protein
LRRKLTIAPHIAGRNFLFCPANYIIGKGENPIYDHDPQDGLADEFKMVRDTRACFTSRSIPAGHAS